MKGAANGARAAIRSIDHFDRVQLLSNGPLLEWLRAEHAKRGQARQLFVVDVDGLVYVPETTSGTQEFARINDILQELGVASGGLGGRLRVVSSPVFQTVLQRTLEGRDHRDLGYRSAAVVEGHKVGKLDGNSILQQAIERNASDIHIEARRERGFVSRIRLRIHGMLVDVSDITEEQAAKLIRSYFTGPSFGAGNMPSDGPGDGMFEYEHAPAGGERKMYTVRLNTLPLVHGGMKLVARLRSPTDVQNLDEAGYHESHLEVIREVSAYAQGIFLFVGPTNSGKSTSLNAVMSAIPEERCVLEMADPVEAYLPNCIHVPVPSNNERERDLAKLLMGATVRQDTDVLVLGEIRDEDTILSAGILAEQGKVVLSTLHTEGVVGIHARLVTLGMKEHLLTLPNFLRGGVAQKLIPVSCRHCSVPMRSLKHLGDRRRRLVERLTGIHPSAENMRFRNPDGCPRCLEGFEGQTLVAEVMTVDAQIRKFYARGDFSTMDRYLIDECGMVTMRAHGFSKIVTGALDPEQVEIRTERITADAFPHERREPMAA